MDKYKGSGLERDVPFNSVLSYIKPVEIACERQVPMAVWGRHVSQKGRGWASF